MLARLGAGVARPAAGLWSGSRFIPERAVPSACRGGGLGLPLHPQYLRAARPLCSKSDDEQKVIDVPAEETDGKDGSDHETTTMIKYDPENVSTFPPVMVLPITRRPLFPGIFHPVEVNDDQIAKALQAVKDGHHPFVGVFLMKEGRGEDVQALKDIDQVYDVGTLANLMRIVPTATGVQVLLSGVRRVKVDYVVQNEPFVTVKVAAVDEVKEEAAPVEVVAPVEGGMEGEVSEHQEGTEEALTKAYTLEIVATIKEILKLNPLFKEQMQMFLEKADLHEPGKLADFGAALTTGDAHELQTVLECTDMTTRLKHSLLLLKKELELSKLQTEISKSVEEKLSANQRRYMLMEQLKQIKKELGLEKDDKEALVNKFTERLKSKTVPEEVDKVIFEEIEKLQSLENTSSEFNVTRNYLDWLTAMPWGQYSEENFDLARAEEVLDQEHYGMDDVKERIKEFIAVGNLCGSVQGKILCFVGPPGVGKTSIGKSIAQALNREFFRFSVGGLSDVSEIKGHRRTYVGAMPGKLTQCLKATKCANPVVLIDEIDKLGRGFQGDPASALLEVLDPSQNSTFSDHYMDVPMDLSKVLFLCTANVIDTIPGPLLDRMEVIRLSGQELRRRMTSG